LIDEVDYLSGLYFCLTKHGLLLQLSLDFKIIKQIHFNEQGNKKFVIFEAKIMLFLFSTILNQTLDRDQFGLL
jgi:hypothetical protein